LGLRFDPVGGGQFKQAVQQIIEVERQPLKALEKRKTLEETRLKLFQDFKSKFGGMDKMLAEFTDFKKFRELKAELGDGNNLMSVTIDKEKAEPGSYTVQLDQLASRTSVISNGFDNPEEPVLGIGFIIIEHANGTTSELFVDEDHSSLNGISNLINRQPESPIRASVIKDSAEPDEPYKLILAGKKEGANDRLVFPQFYFLDGTHDFYISDEHEAQNGLIYLDDFPIELESNTVKDFLMGVNIHARQARPEQPFTLTISEDFKKVADKVSGLVNQLNGILEFINKQNQVDDKSDTRATFTGDSGLQNVEYRIRNLLHEGFPIGDPEEPEFKFMFMGELGIEFGKDGKLNFKEDKFVKTMEGNFDSVSEAITGGFGLASQLREVISTYTRMPDGTLNMREQNLHSRIKRIDRDIADKERRIDQRAKSLTDQFSRLEASLGGLQRQQQYLSATLGTASGGAVISQLLGG
jgi:flagellar hook-associated protein 2